MVLHLWTYFEFPEVPKPLYVHASQEFRTWINTPCSGRQCCTNFNNHLYPILQSSPYRVSQVQASFIECMVVNIEFHKSKVVSIKDYQSTVYIEYCKFAIVDAAFDMLQDNTIELHKFSAFEIKFMKLGTHETVAECGCRHYLDIKRSLAYHAFVSAFSATATISLSEI